MRLSFRGCGGLRAERTFCSAALSDAWPMIQPKPDSWSGPTAKGAATSYSRAVFGIELLEFGIAAKDRQVGIAPRPVGVLESVPPGLAQRVERLGLPVHRTEGAGGVVLDHRLVGAEEHGEVRLPDGIFLAPLDGVEAGHQDPCPRILGHLPQVSL